MSLFLTGESTLQCSTVVTNVSHSNMFNVQPIRACEPPENEKFSH